MTYRVEVTNGQQTHTLYEGKSVDRARDMADAARTALITGKGTADVILREGETPDMAWSVKDGYAFLALIGGVAAAKKADAMAGKEAR